MSVLRAMPTSYRGIRFRSKLEADWAISLDGFGIEWEYESEGRYWGDVYYAPDFWLPKSRQWFEVKGQPTSQDYVKWAALESHWTHNSVPQVASFAEAGIDVPALVIGCPHGELQLPRTLIDLAALPEYDADGIPNWPDEWRGVMLATGQGFFGYSHDTDPPEAFQALDGLWVAMHGFPYWHGSTRGAA